jgi:putative phosphonate metabolism protein
MSGRYAVYFALEPGSDLARFGAAWLGYDVATGQVVVQPSITEIDPERLHVITAEPRRYGFHATLKPPFVLAEETDADALAAAVAALANSIAAFTAPRLHLTSISGFLALTMSEPCAAMHDLADRCVSELDRFRAPPPVAELERRRRANLSARQDELLIRWGYPYVMEEFRFHMTLTARLNAEEGAIVRASLAPLVAPLCQSPLAVDAISLFHQPSTEAPFHLLKRYEFFG